MPKPYNKIFLFILLSFSVSLFTGCDLGRVSTPDTGTETGQAASQGYPMEKFTQNNDCYNVEIQYPFLGRPELDQQVLVWVDTHYNDTAKKWKKYAPACPGIRTGLIPTRWTTK